MESTPRKLTLWYFPFPGRGGAIRDAFRIGRVPFTDETIDADTFRKKKAAGELPFGSMPVLIVEERRRHVVSQSNAILRYAGKLGGLYPMDDHLAALRVDEILDAAEEATQSLGVSIGEEDPDRKAALRRKMAEEDLPRWFGRLERILDQNGTSDHFVGTSLTVADLKMLYVIEKYLDGSLDGIPTTVMGPFGKLLAWRKNIRAVRDGRVAGRSVGP